MIQEFGWNSVEFLLKASVWTVLMSAIAFVGGGIAGLSMALLRVLGPKPVQLAVMTVIQLVQATPLLILVFLAYYGLSLVGLYFPPLVAAGLSLAIYSAVYLSEIWRGCIEAIPRQQWEAADALAMTAGQKLRYVILPQALRISAAPTVGFLVQVIKNSSVTSLIGFIELTRAGQLLNNATFQPFPVFLSVAVIYFCLCYPLSYLSQRLKGVAHV